MRKKDEKLKKDLLIHIIIQLIIGSILIILLLLFQNKFDLLGWLNAVSVTTVLLLSFAWLSFANSKGVFDMLVYGTKKFFSNFSGKKINKTFFEMRMEKPSVNKRMILSILLTSSIFLVATIILSIIWYSNN